MKLYKYVDPSRTDILSRGLIRFTQPRHFNDPFEMSPYISAIATEDEICAIFDQKHESEIEEQYKKRNRNYRRKISLDEFSKRFPKDEMLPLVLESSKGRALDKAKEQLDDAMTNSIGILCLTKKPDNLLMWAHYAKSHTGMVIEFEVTDDFLIKQYESNEKLESVGIKIDEDYRCLKKINYSELRPNITVSNVKNFDQFLVKSSDWSYEEEWRILMPTSQADYVDSNEFGEVFLFQISKMCIKKVIFGCRASEKLINEVIKIREKDGELNHLELKKMILDKENFSLNSINL